MCALVAHAFFLLWLLRAIDCGFREPLTIGELTWCAPMRVLLHVMHTPRVALQQQQYIYIYIYINVPAQEYIPVKFVAVCVCVCACVHIHSISPHLPRSLQHRLLLAISEADHFITKAGELWPVARGERAQCRAVY